MESNAEGPASDGTLDGLSAAWSWFGELHWGSQTGLVIGLLLLVIVVYLIWTASIPRASSGGRTFRSSPPSAGIGWRPRRI